MLRNSARIVQQKCCMLNKKDAPLNKACNSQEIKGMQKLGKMAAAISR